MGFEPWTVTELYGIHGTGIQQKYVVTQRHRSSDILFFSFFHFSPILPLLAPILPYFLYSSFLAAQADSNSNISEAWFFFFVCTVRLSAETQNILRLLEFSRYFQVNNKYCFLLHNFYFVKSKSSHRSTFTKC